MGSSDDRRCGIGGRGSGIIDFDFDISTSGRGRCTYILNRVSKLKGCLIEVWVVERSIKILQSIILAYATFNEIQDTFDTPPYGYEVGNIHPQSFEFVCVLSGLDYGERPFLSTELAKVLHSFPIKDPLTSPFLSFNPLT